MLILKNPLAFVALGQALWQERGRLQEMVKRAETILEQTDDGRAVLAEIQDFLTSRLTPPGQNQRG